MKGPPKRLSDGFRAGQTWHVNNRYLYISQVGKTLVHYRMLRQPGRSAGAGHVASKQEVQAYLERFNAREVILSANP